MYLKSAIRHWWIIFVAELKRLAAYRAQFWCELILSSIAELVIIIAVWRAVFESSGQTVLNGFSFEQMVLYLAVAIFFGQASRGTGMGTLQREIYEGTFTKFLIYPLSVYSYKLGTFMPRAVFAIGQMTIALMFLYWLGYWPANSSLQIEFVCTGFLALLLACLLYFFLLVSVEALAFWVDNVWALAYAMQIGVVFLSGKVIPIDFFPDWAQQLLSLSPFPLMVYFPVQVFLGQLSYSEILMGLTLGLIWSLLLFALSKVIMQRGLYQYTGVGQ